MEWIIMQMVLLMKDDLVIFSFSLVERYDLNGLVETLPDLNIKRHGCGCTKFIVSFIYRVSQNKIGFRKTS